MKRSLTFFLFLALLCLDTWGQKVHFEIQAGLSSMIKKTTALEKDRVVAIATTQGDLLTWNIPQNKLGGRQHLGDEIYDLVYLPANNVLAVSTPEYVRFYRYEGEGLQFLGNFECDNPTALEPYRENLLVVTRNRILELRVEAFPEVLRSVAKESHPSYAVREFNGKICEASNSGFHIYDFKDDAGSNDPGISSADLDTGAVEPVTEAAVPRPFASLKQFNTGWYAHAWDLKTKRLVASQESDLLVFDYASGVPKSYKIDLPLESEDYITALCFLGENLYAGTRSGKVFILKADLQKAGLLKPIQLNPASVTHFASFSGLILAGNYYGDVDVLDPRSLAKVISINDESTPSLNAVYLDQKRRMITTHRDASGAVLRIWNIDNASLKASIRFRTHQVLAVSFAGDSIITTHADGASYAILPRGEAYDTISLARPLVQFEPGFGLELPDHDPMMVIQRSRSELREATRMPGTYSWVDSSNARVTYVVPPVPPDCESMPSYELVQAYLKWSGLLEHMADWDVMDQDLFFMKACRYTEEKFLEYIETTKLPRDKSLVLFKSLKNSLPPKLSVISAGGDTLFAIRQSGLQFLHYDKQRKSWIALYDSAAFVYDVASGKLSSMKIDLPEAMFHFAFNGEMLAVATSDRLKLYSFTQGATTWLSFGERNFLVYNEQGYYRTKGRSDRLTGYIDGEEKPFAFFDLAYNKPEDVIRQLAGPGSAEAKAFELAGRKRKQRLEGKMPGEIIAGENELKLPFYTISKQLQVQLPTRKDHKPVLWINGVREKNFDTGTRQVLLSPGLNKVELHWNHVNGTSAIQAPATYVYSSAAGDGKLYFFGAGIDQYADPSIGLEYATKDIRDLARAFVNTGENPAVTATRFNAEVGEGGWLTWKQQLSKTAVNDMVIVSLSGHGFLDSTGKFHFASPGSTAERFQSAISYDGLLELLDAAPARRKILFIDACHSGLLDDESREVSLPPGVSIKTLKRRDGGATSSSLPFRLMQEEFVDLTRHNGTIVVAAAAGSEFAMESSDKKNGLFTYVLMKGLFEQKADLDKDRRVTTAELQQYLSTEVEILSRGGQKPSTNQDNQGIDWPLLEY